MIVEVGALRARIDLVEPDDALRRDERAIEMPLVQLVILAEARRNNFLQVKSHAEWSAIYTRNANLGFPVAMSNEGAGL